MFHLTLFSGQGLLNDAINNLPFELHAPGYSFCGHGPQLEKRLAREDRPINELDRKCRHHDIFYSKHKDTKQRHEADEILGKEAVKRFKSIDASLG